MRQLIAASRAPGSQLAGVVQRHQLACNRHTLGPSFFNEVFGAMELRIPHLVHSFCLIVAMLSECLQ